MLFGIDGIDTVAETRATPIESVDPTPVAQSTRAPAVAAAATPAAATPQRSTMRFVSQEVAQKVPTPVQRASTPAPTRVAAASQPEAEPRRTPVATGSADTHLIQLGSFDSREVAEQKWNEFKRRFPALSAHDVVITEALVNGRTYFRVAAAGFGSRSAASMCGTVKASGVGCFAYAKTNPPAGAVDRGVRIAARSR
jgi:septal ring-binding cell division protein DamX